MGRYVPIRFNDDEASFLERSFAASDDQALSTHIKRVYFDALTTPWILCPEDGS